MIESSNEAVEAEARPTATDVEVAGTEARPDLVWDNEARGLCVRVHGNGAQSFIFVYRHDGRQRFVRIGTTPRWSVEGARRWAKKLRSAVERGDDPEDYNRERQKIANREQKITPVENLLQFIAENQESEPKPPVRCGYWGQLLTRDARRIAANIAIYYGRVKVPPSVRLDRA